MTRLRAPLSFWALRSRSFLDGDRTDMKALFCFVSIALLGLAGCGKPAADVARNDDPFATPKSKTVKPVSEAPSADATKSGAEEPAADPAEVVAALEQAGAQLTRAGSPARVTAIDF